MCVHPSGMLLNVQSLILLLFLSLPSDMPPLFSDTEATVQVMRTMTAVLECTAESIGPTSYSWVPSENLVTNTSEITVNPSGSTLIISHVQYSDAGMYTCQATNLFGQSYKSWDLRVVGKEKLHYVESD